MKATEREIILFEKYKISRQTLIMALGILGILLIGLGPMLFRSKPKSNSVPQANQSVQQTSKEYAYELEGRLQTILSEIDGVGEVKVMVTIKNGYRSVYAVAEKINSDTLEDVKAEDEKKTQEKIVTEQTYLFVEGNDGKEPLITVQLEPEVKGVVVVCEGGNNPVVVGKVVDAVKVALGISSTMISVSKLSA